MREEQSITATLHQIIVEAIQGALAELHTGLPARVVSFDPATQSASVMPLLRRVVRDEGGDLQTLDLPVISHVPVIYAAGGGWSITFPLAPGDIVHLAFAERSMDDWLVAPPGSAVTARQRRRFDLSDAVAIPGLRQRTNPIPGISADALRISNDAGTVAIELSAASAKVSAPVVEVTSGDVRVGTGADSPFVRYVEWAVWAAAHVHTSAAPGSPTTPPVTPPNPAIASTTSKVK